MGIISANQSLTWNGAWPWTLGKGLKYGLFTMCYINRNMCDLEHADIKVNSRWIILLCIQYSINLITMNVQRWILCFVQREKIFKICIARSSDNILWCVLKHSKVALLFFNEHIFILIQVCLLFNVPMNSLHFY